MNKCYFSNKNLKSHGLKKENIKIHYKIFPLKRYNFK